MKPPRMTGPQIAATASALVVTVVICVLSVARCSHAPQPAAAPAVVVVKQPAAPASDTTRRRRKAGHAAHRRKQPAPPATRDRLSEPVPRTAPADSVVR